MFSASSFLRKYKFEKAKEYVNMLRLIYIFTKTLFFKLLFHLHKWYMKVFSLPQIETSFMGSAVFPFNINKQSRLRLLAYM